jgi:hypothetical protein
MKSAKKIKKIILYGALWGLLSILFTNFVFDLFPPVTSTFLEYTLFLPLTLASVVAEPFKVLGVYNPSAFYFFFYPVIVCIGILLAFSLNLLILPHTRKFKRKTIIIILLSPLVLTLFLDVVKVKLDNNNLMTTMNDLHLPGKVLETSSSKTNTREFQVGRYYQIPENSLNSVRNELTKAGWICDYTTWDRFGNRVCKNAKQQDVEMTFGEAAYDNYYGEDKKLYDYSQRLPGSLDIIYKIELTKI